ncbi:MAG: hydrogenase formation protein HypD [Candidatus Competibacterales bacterium]
MPYIDEFRDPALARQVLERIGRLAAKMGLGPRNGRSIMEICGGHTHAIFRYGLDRLMPAGIEFVHGPGCPVCVLPRSRVDDGIEIAQRPEVIFTTFGDAMRVPGSGKSLLQAKAAGADIRMVYSPLDALALARRNPDRQVVFFGLGFETTMPATAITLQRAAAGGIDNFKLFCNHILLPPPLKALLADAELKLDGFVGPGHVSLVIGTEPYGFIPRDFHKPLVVAGFEPLDLLQAVYMVLGQMARGEAKIENQYGRVVPRHGNPVALAAMDEVFEPRPSFAWRGLGEIDRSGVQIRPRYAAFDAERHFQVGYGAGMGAGREPEGLPCGDVLKGAIRPWNCPMFGRECRPEAPLGALMVSSEGACAAYYQYAGRRTPPGADEALAS